MPLAQKAENMTESTSSKPSLASPELPMTPDVAKTPPIRAEERAKTDPRMSLSRILQPNLSSDLAKRSPATAEEMPNTHSPTYLSRILPPLLRENFAENGAPATSDVPKRGGRKRMGSVNPADTASSQAKKVKGKDNERIQIVEVDTTNLGHGSYSTKARRFVWQANDCDLRVSRTAGNLEYFEMRKQESEDGSYHQLKTESAKVETKDGFPLVMFLKRGMYTGHEGQEQELREKSESAFREFAQAYPPELPNKTDARHRLALEHEKAEWTKKNLPFGRLHLGVWHEMGKPNKPLFMSSDARVKDEGKLEALRTFMQETAWEHEQTSAWLKHLDYEAWEPMNARYRELNDKGLLQHLYQGTNGCSSMLVPLVNLSVQPHKDRYDARRSWTSTNPWGDYEGAWVVFPELGIMIYQEPGDIVWCRSAYLEHWVSPILRGQRYCNTRFNKQNVLFPLDQWVRCPVPECTKTMGRVLCLGDHIKKYHSKLSDEEVVKIISALEANAFGGLYNDKEVRSLANMLKKRSIPFKRNKK